MAHPAADGGALCGVAPLERMVGPCVGRTPFCLRSAGFFSHANFTWKILLLFIFFIISYLSLPDVFRAVFCVCGCCKLIPFMF